MRCKGKVLIGGRMLISWLTKQRRMKGRCGTSDRSTYCFEQLQFPRTACKPRIMGSWRSQLTLWEFLTMCHVASPYKGILQGNFTLGSNCPHRNYLGLERLSQNRMSYQFVIPWEVEVEWRGWAIFQIAWGSNSYNNNNDGDEVVHICIHCHTHFSLHCSKGDRIVIII